MGEAKRRRLTDPNYGTEPKRLSGKGWRPGSRWDVLNHAYRHAARPTGESRQTVRHSLKGVGRPSAVAGRSLADPSRGPTRAPFAKGLSAAKFATGWFLSKNNRRRLSGRERSA